MEDWNAILLVIGIVVLAVGAISALLRRVCISPMMMAFGAGVVCSQTGLEWAGLQSENAIGTVFEETIRVTLALGLMETALRVPNSFIVAHWRRLVALVACMMVLMWALSSAVAWVFLPVGVLAALVVGAVLTPTDPVLASSIVSGAFAEKYLPERMRHRISFESGANDGVGLLFVALPLVLLHAPASEGLREWFLVTFLWEVLFGTFLGIVLGLTAGALLHFAESRGYIERASYLAYSVALTLVVLGLAQLIHTDGILAVFVAGVAFTAVLEGSEEAENEFVQEAFNQFFLLPAFVFFGLLAPWEAWVELGPWCWAFVVAVLLLRRIPAVFLARRLLRPLDDWRSLAFFGWFGPLGIAALFYAVHAKKVTGDEFYWEIGSLAVFASIFAHGISAPFLIQRYGHWMAGKEAKEKG